jgi:hypothetical protein
MKSKNLYLSPEAEELELRMTGALLSLSDGAPDVDIDFDTEDNTFA